MASDQYENKLSSSEELAADLATIQPRLYGFILKRLANREQTQEVLQRTNLVICQKAREFQSGSSFVAWAFTIAKFQIMAWRKTACASRLVFTGKVYELLDRGAEEEATSVDERIPRLRSCLERLRESDRELIQRRYLDGEHIESIARTFARSIDAIGMRLLRIRKALARCIRTQLNQEPRHEH
jgi:RNA polymerase sigma-70 factor (ECF subfamily)